MADNAALARPYAKAVFDIAQQSNAFDDWAHALESLASISLNEQFNALLSDPRVGTQQLVDLLTDLNKDALPDGGTNFINLLAQNNRLGVLADISAQYTELVAKAKALVNAQVISALALSDEQKAAITEALEQRLNMQVALSETVDAQLIGGAIIKAGDLVIDGSAQGRIEKLTSVLMK